ncbi:MAG TPA: DNA-deoxyinosine glycosylase [Sphingomicrobium sp.]|nr:DNA-deoxyinosine glycosylase [Sphingomicrobium sp.]
MEKRGLPPIAGPSTRLFILGSLPGDRSLEEGRYYAHPTNQFWKLVGAVVDEDLARLDYGDRLAVLAKHGIGLWDVIGAARREGSADHAIRDAAHNPIGGLKRDYPKLEAVAFNGGRAAKDGRRLLSGIDDVELLALPSSSGLAAIPFAEKARAWSVLERFCTS